MHVQERYYYYTPLVLYTFASEDPRSYKWKLRGKLE